MFFVRARILDKIETVICEDVTKSAILKDIVVLSGCQHFIISSIFRVSELYIRNSDILIMANGKVDDLPEDDDLSEDDETIS